MSERQYAAHLLDEPPMLVYPSLAVLLGINHAVVFQQLHFLINGQKTAKNKYNYVADKQGVMRWWVYNSYPDWRRDYFPWLTVAALKKIFPSLENDHLVLSMQGVKSKSDRRKWYTIDYEAWDKKCLMMGEKVAHQPSATFYPMMGEKIADESSETSSKTPTEIEKSILKIENPKAESDWLRAYSQLEIQLDRASFDTWVRAAHFLKCEDNIYTIGVAHQYARDMLQHRLYRDVRRILSNVVGAPVELLFQVHKLPIPDEGDLPLFKRLAQEP